MSWVRGNPQSNKSMLQKKWIIMFVCQVGPTAVKAFHEVLVRLQLRCAEENECLFRELLLRLVYQLSTDRYTGYLSRFVLFISFNPRKI